MKIQFYVIAYLLCSSVMVQAQVKGRIQSTVWCFPGGNLGIHASPMSFAAHIKTSRSNFETNSVVFTDGAFAEGTNDAGYVNGYVTKTGSQPFTFPVGDQEGGDSRPLTISMANPAPIKLAVAYWKGHPGKELDPTGGPHDTNAMSTAGTAGVDKLESISEQGFWDWIPLSKSGTESAIRIEVSIPDHSGNDGYAASDIRLVGWNTKAQMWENLSGSLAPTGNKEGTIVTGSLTTSTMFDYSAITIGSTSSAPLPVRLISFAAKNESDLVHLNWKTSEETNAGYFEIERSPNAKDWKVIGKQNAAGESAAVLAYSFTDAAATQGVNYYRLKIVDHDATFAYSKVVSVSLENLGHFLTMYPNPVSEILTIKDMEIKKMEQVSIRDISGKTVYQSNEVSSGNIDVSRFTNGFYLVTVRLDNGNLRTGKILIQH